MRYSKIAGTGSFLPEKILTNADLAKMVDTTHEWIVERTGIHQRHVVTENDSTASMATAAAKHALEMANLTASEMDMIIVATTTPDMIIPNVACMVQEALDVPGIPAFDISAACSGFIYGLSMADSFIRSGMASNILLIGSETMTNIVDWNDRSTCILFGDGAGAAILQASEVPGVLSTHLHADGREGDKLWVEGNLPGQQHTDKSYVHMSGREVFKFAVHSLGQIVDETLAANNLDKSAIDWLIPHQANYRIISATAKKLNLAMDRVVLTVNKHGNTSAASVPLALDGAIREGKIKSGDILLLEAIGGGFSWGSALIKY